jgi:hypothetical protein
LRSETRPPAIPSSDPLRRLAVAFVSAGLVLAAAACGVHTADSESGPQFPPGPSFDHASHLDKGIECIDCHEDFEDEAEAGMPEWDFCMECHEDLDEEREEGKKLADLFMDPDGNPRWHNVTKQDEDIIFSHATHVSAEVECSECHTGIEQSQRVAFDLRQDMDDCMTCHAERETSNECATCHVTIGPDWKPPSHSRLWMTLHGQEVRMGGAPDGITDDCALCHTQTMCADCHRTQPPRDHKESWRRGGGHGIAASMDRARCQTCHEVHSCRACHENARPRSHRGSWGGRRSRHCLSSCHEPLRPGAGDGCGVCHMGTPSHDRAPAKPGWHTADMDCLLCHSPLSHADNGQNCNSCHR